MEFCHQAGIPHSEFLSWSEHDQEAEIEYMLYDKGRCPGCGTFPEEWLDENGRPYTVDPYVTKSINCLGCETLAAAREEIPAGKQQHVYVYLQVNEEAHRGRSRSNRRQGSSNR